jgi:eukaryotic-like serine/threonine-protein kinase
VVSEHLHNSLDSKICLECNRQFTGIVSACPHDGTPLVGVVKDPLVGTTLAGNYEILEFLGQGGMGVVYKARHALMDRIVAIKMLQAALISDSMSVKRFQQESKAASRISHPNVISVYDFGISPTGQPYIVMDFLAGTSLSSIIKTDGQVSVERTIKILAPACDGLHHAHRQGVIHRDLKPSNIVLIEFNGEKDFVKVVDFGVAKITGSTESQRLTQFGEVCGSPVYMSPEQCRGEDLDRRSDIYSMGCVIYETLTGQLPILGKSMVETMSRHVTEMPRSFSEARPDLYIPERLEQVVFKALAKSREDRHQSMEELAQDLDHAIPRPGRSQVLRTVPLTPLKEPEPVKKPFYKSNVFRVASTAGLVVVSTFAIIGWAMGMHSLFGRPQHVAVYPIKAPLSIPATVAPPQATTPAAPPQTTTASQASVPAAPPQVTAPVQATPLVQATPSVQATTPAQVTAPAQASLPVTAPASETTALPAVSEQTAKVTTPKASQPKLASRGQDGSRYARPHHAPTEVVHRRAYSTTYYESSHESSGRNEADRWRGLQALKSRY